MSGFVIVAGPNGSGKTTLVRSGVFASVLGVPDVSLNADDVARDVAGGSQPTEEQSLLAARITDARLDAEIAAGRSVMVETVLSSDKYQPRVGVARAAGYRIDLVYVTVREAALNVARVDQRVAAGGHAVPLDRIRDRRARSHTLFRWFAEAADRVFVFDNSLSQPRLAAVKGPEGWALLDLGALPADLGRTLSELAEPGPMT